MSDLLPIEADISKLMTPLYSVDLPCSSLVILVTLPRYLTIPTLKTKVEQTYFLSRFPRTVLSFNRSRYASALLKAVSLENVMSIAIL